MYSGATMLRNHDGTLAARSTDGKEVLGWTIAVCLLLAAAFELVLALQHRISPNGEGFVLLLALMAILGGAVLGFRGVRAAPLFAPVAAFFVTARFYTGDPYYAPTFRAYGDGGLISPVWMFVLLGLGLLAGVATLVWRRTAPPVSGVVLLLLAVTALFMGAGH
jgi:uncharacterized membrane protein HdeD (DUF308 family)